MAKRFLLIAGLALALAGCGDDDDADTDTAQRPATTEKTTTQERTTPKTETGGTTTERPNPKVATVSLTVSSFIEAVEQSDAARACRLLGQPPRGSDPAAVQGCAAEAGVTLDRLPTTDELSIEDVKFSGAGAVVRLGGRSTMRLRRSGGRYRVVAFVPAPVNHP